MITEWFHAASSTACPRSCGKSTAWASSRTRSRAERGCRHRLYPSDFPWSSCAPTALDVVVSPQLRGLHTAGLEGLDESSPLTGGSRLGAGPNRVLDGEFESATCSIVRQSRLGPAQPPWSKITGYRADLQRTVCTPLGAEDAQICRSRAPAAPCSVSPRRQGAETGGSRAGLRCACLAYPSGSEAVPRRRGRRVADEGVTQRRRVQRGVFSVAFVLSDWLDRMMGTPPFVNLANEHRAAWSPSHTIAWTLDRSHVEVVMPDTQTVFTRSRTATGQADVVVDNARDSRYRMAEPGGRQPPARLARRFRSRSAWSADQ